MHKYRLVFSVMDRINGQHVWRPLFHLEVWAANEADAYDAASLLIPSKDSDELVSPSVELVE